VNVNAEIRDRYLRLLADRLPSALDGLNLLELGSALVDSIASVAKEKHRLLQADADGFGSLGTDAFTQRRVSAGATPNRRGNSFDAGD
jgi:hypothetical protein